MGGVSFIESFICFGVLLLTLGNAAVTKTRSGAEQLTQQESTSHVADTLSLYGYEHIGFGKYAAVMHFPRTITWHGASRACQSHLPGAGLFTVDSPQDDDWMGRRINFEKARISGSSKFWVGLIAKSTRGPLLWLNGHALTTSPNIVQVAGYDDASKKYAMAVPDGLISKFKYEFLTSEDEAEASICQYIAA